MKIAVLSRSPNIHSTKRLVEAARARDHEVRVVDHVRCLWTSHLIAHPCIIRTKNSRQSTLMRSFRRIGASVTFYGTAIVRQFEMMGVVNESVAITRQPLV